MWYYFIGGCKPIVYATSELNLISLCIDTNFLTQLTSSNIYKCDIQSFPPTIELSKKKKKSLFVLVSYFYYSIKLKMIYTSSSNPISFSNLLWTHKFPHPNPQLIEVSSYGFGSLFLSIAICHIKVCY